MKRERKYVVCSIKSKFRKDYKLISYTPGYWLCISGDPHTDYYCVIVFKSVHFTDLIDDRLKPEHMKELGILLHKVIGLLKLVIHLLNGNSAQCPRDMPQTMAFERFGVTESKLKKPGSDKTRASGASGTHGPEGYTKNLVC